MDPLTILISRINPFFPRLGKKNFSCAIFSVLAIFLSLRMFLDIGSVAAQQAVSSDDIDRPVSWGNHELGQLRDRAAPSRARWRRFIVRRAVALHDHREQLRARGGWRDRTLAHERGVGRRQAAALGEESVAPSARQIAREMRRRARAVMAANTVETMCAYTAVTRRM